ncbi:MAG: FadR family transcriptional regulator [Dinoroseobacter sp.]|nr:FadR family transcriptional regulator [Dinoroseobacter sp.]
MKIDHDNPADLSAQIAEAIRDSIISGAMIVDERLPSESDLAEQFDVSRSTIREALKRLAAQSLIRTQRGAFGGAFVNRLSYDDAREQLITTSTLLLSMNEVSFDTACEARFALERACASMAVERRLDAHLDIMEREIARQSDADLSDEAFCASDVAFHRALVDAACNPVLSYQLSGSIEAMQPLMNMITFTARSRAQIIEIHSELTEALRARDTQAAKNTLNRLESYTKQLAHAVMSAKSKKRH